MSSAAARWRRALKSGGYDAPPVTRLTGLRFAVLSRAWRRILRHTGLGRTGAVRALEVGCAGGQQCIRLFANGWHCVGLDLSPEVIGRARLYARRVKQVLAPRGSMRFVVGDFMTWRPPARRFDLVFHVGVLEHFLDRRRRLAFLRRMFLMARPGGWVMSMVPNGLHVMRAEQRRKGLGGYNVPEIDYSSRLVAREMEQCGAAHVEVLHHNVFGYLRIKPSRGLMKPARLAAYGLLQAFPWRVMPRAFLDRHAYWLIGLGRKA
ncbi:MAG: methyltransferase domain-containing protein [Candidatus Coatesbacteria bacterium]